MFDAKINDIEIIRNLQNDIFSKLKKCWGYNVWFIIQIQLGVYFTYISSKYVNSKDLLNRGIIFGRKGYRSAFMNFLKSLYYLFFNYRKYKNKWREITILAGYKSNNIKRNECSYNIYLEPYQILLNEKGVKNEVIWLDKINDDKFFLSLYNINYFLLIIEKIFFPKHFLNVKYNANLVYSRLKDKYKHSVYLNNFISNNIILNKLYYDTFRCLLKILTPKSIFTYSYYDNILINPLIRAANYLNIETAEYQHSHFSDLHYAYTKWDYIDEYRIFFPNKFFVWSDYHKNIINRNFSGKSYIPQIIVSGNYYIKQEKNNLIKKCASNDILVCLQGTWIPEFVEDVVINSNNIKWYFRLHPRCTEDKGKLFSFFSTYPDKVEIDKANNYTLYELFGNVGTIITIQSGAALEAKEFGLRIIIVDPYGYDCFKDYIDNGDFNYAENEEQLLNLINKK